MRALTKILSGLLILLLTACGQGGDTEELKQTVEQNKFNITSLVIKPVFTQTLNPLTNPPDKPVYYFDHDDTEKLQVFGITATNDEIPLSNIIWSLGDSSGSSGIDQNGVLTTEALPANQTKTISVNAGFAALNGSADIVISSYPLSPAGLSIKIGDSVVNDTTQDIVVCDSLAFSAQGSFEDGSIRDITTKIDWTKAINNNNAKFVVSEQNEAIFSSHTNANYILQADYKAQATASLDLSVSQTGFHNFTINPKQLTLAPDETYALQLGADIDTGNGNVEHDVSNTAKWVSGNDSIITVDDAGLVTAISEGGPVEVMAQCGSVSISTSISVAIDNTILYVKILDENYNNIDYKELAITNNVGGTVNLKLRAYMQDGSTLDVTTDENTTWEIRTLPGLGDPISVNNTDDKGLVTAIASGTAEVVAKYNNREDDITVIVTSN